MKKATRILALVLCAVMCLGLFVGCGNKGKQNNDTPLVVGYSPFNSKFSPFFSETAYDQDVWTMTAISLLNGDRQGAIIMKGIEGETKAYNGTDYTYYGPADCEIVENTDGTVDYNFKLREDLKFSDGEPITIDDVIFSMYVLCDPTYDGNSTLFALPIEGMDAYRSGMDTLYNLMLAAGRDNTDFTNNKWTEEEQTAFWADVDQAGVKFVQAIMQYCIAQGANAEGDSVAACMKNWGFELPADATEADAFNAIVAKYPSLAEAVDAEKPEGTTFTSLLNDYETKYTKGIKTGDSAANISGIKKTGDYSMTVTLTQVDATAIYQLGVTIAPMHYYGEKTKYNYENNQFGFDKGDLSHVREKTTTSPWVPAPTSSSSSRMVPLTSRLTIPTIWAPPRPSMSTSCRLRKTISSTASSPAPWISPILPSAPPPWTPSRLPTRMTMSTAPPSPPIPWITWAMVTSA